MESEITKLYIFTSNFCLMFFNYSVCDGGLFTCTNESCDGELIQKEAPHGIFITALNSNCITAIDQRGETNIPSASEQ